VLSTNGRFSFIDLFAGAGGLSEGFISEGYIPVAHVEMNPDACLTLQTRICYYYLRENNNLELYYQYLRGNIDRMELYSHVPKKELETVLNHTMSKESMPALFRRIDSLKKLRGISSIDVIVGGPPCQAYSIVGRARTAKTQSMQDDPRNTLYLLYCRVLKKYQPYIFVFENVPGLLTASGGRYFSNMKKAFKRFGYEIHYNILNAMDFGVLQKRRRVFLIGWKKGTNHMYPEFTSQKCCYTVNDVLRDLPIIQSGETDNKYKDFALSNYLRDYRIREENDILTWNVARPHIDRDREIYRHVIRAWDQYKTRLKYTSLPGALKTHRNTSAFLDRFKVVASDLQACHTVTAHISKDGHYFIHPDINQARSLTVREAARLQSFPDNFFFEGSRTAVFTQIGNAVPPLMAKGIACGVHSELEREIHKL